MENKFRVAMIGAGSRANEVIYPAFHSLEDVDITAICDIDPERLKATADRYQIERRYGDNVYSYQTMIKEVKPDAVVAVGQPHIMYDIWAWCLSRGIDLYIEKPLALTLHQARSLACLAERNHCITQVSFQRRRTPVVEQLRDACLAHGPITHALCRFYKCDQHDFLGARDHMMDDCVHSIDTLRWICGGEIQAIESTTRRVGTSDINYISATLHFDNGSIGYLLNSWSSGRRIFAVEMHAPGVCAEVEHEKGGYLYENGDTEGVRYESTACAGSDEFFIYTGVQNAAREFVASCRTRKQPASCFQDALKTMEAAEAILAQSTLRDFSASHRGTKE